MESEKEERRELNRGVRSETMELTGSHNHTEINDFSGLHLSPNYPLLIEL